VTLIENQRFTLTTRPVAGDEREVSTTYQALPRDCRRGDTILLDDGNIALLVEDVNDTDVVCTVTDGGDLKPNKGINLPGVQVSAPAMSEKDRHDVDWGFKQNLDYVALSFVRQANEVRELKQMARERGATTRIIAKLEKPEAIENLEEIIEAADGVMVARGDLGVEMAPEEVPLLQKRIIRTANQMGKLVITATQMLESMTYTQRPTRAEASDVANAVLDGSDALMLSGETASGQNPLLALQMMARIIEEIEVSTDSGWTNMRRLDRGAVTEFPPVICEAAAHAAAALGAKAIACFTETGNTARLLSNFRPPVPIIAFTAEDYIARQLNLSWGISPHVIDRSDNTDVMLAHADEFLLRSGLVSLGDTVVVTMGAPVACYGSTNTMKLHRIGTDAPLTPLS
jgi:pyruvate kinase